MRLSKLYPTRRLLIMQQLVASADIRRMHVGLGLRKPPKVYPLAIRENYAVRQLQDHRRNVVFRFVLGGRAP